MVPAPTSMSYGCCNTQPRSAQNFCRLRISSWYVGGAGMDNRETFNLTDSLSETPSEARGPYDLKNIRVSEIERDKCFGLQICVGNRVPSLRSGFQKQT